MNNRIVNENGKHWQQMSKKQICGLFGDDGKCWERISKRKARNLYNKGVSIVIAPCKIHPFGVMGGLEINNGLGYDFDRWVNNFEHYNCNYECGYYAAFWKELN